MHVVHVYVYHKLVTKRNVENRIYQNRIPVVVSKEEAQNVQTDCQHVVAYCYYLEQKQDNAFILMH